MKIQKSFILHHRLSILLIALSFPFLAVCAANSVLSTAQTPQQEREIEDKIPKHLPIRVKVNNLDKVKDLNNEKWIDDLEVEVKNVSDKPIYFLDIQLVLPEMKSPDGYEISFTLRYGRIQLIDLGEPLQSDDLPIRPGESYTFKIPEKNVKGWKGFASERRLQKSEPKRLQLEFYLLNFGDGTGYRNSTGKAFDIHKKKAINGSCGGKENKNYTIATLLNWPPAPSLQSQVSFIPANFQPVKLSLGIINSTSNTIPMQDVCCPGTPCSYRKPKFYTCGACGDTDSTESASCNDPIGDCSIDTTRVDTCQDAYGNTLYCTKTFTGPCCTIDNDHDGFASSSCGGPDCCNTVATT